MTQKRSNTPYRSNPDPPLQMRLRSRAFIQLLHNNRIDSFVRSFECQFLLPEVRPVEVLGVEEREDKAVGEGREGGCYRAVYAGEDLARCGYGCAAVEGFGGAEPDCKAGRHAEERGDDGGEAALAAPEDGECGGEYAGAGEYTWRGGLTLNLCFVV